MRCPEVEPLPPPSAVLPERSDSRNVAVRIVDRVIDVNAVLRDESHGPARRTYPRIDEPATWMQGPCESLRKEWELLLRRRLASRDPENRFAAVLREANACIIGSAQRPLLMRRFSEVCLRASCILL